MPTGRPRHGTLTDAQTLALYEFGVAAEDLAFQEGVRPGTILGRISHARRERRRPTHHASGRHLRLVHSISSESLRDLTVGR